MGPGGVDATAEGELATTGRRVRSRKKRRISVRRSKSSLVDKSRSYPQHSVQSFSVGCSNQTTPKDDGPVFGRLNSTQQRRGKHIESPVRDRRVVTYEESHVRVPRKFVPPKATGVVLGPRSRSCGLTRHGSQRESSSSRLLDAGTGVHPRTRSHESIRSTESGQKPAAHRIQQDASPSSRGTPQQRSSMEPRRSRYESYRMRTGAVEDISQADYVDQDDMEVVLRCESGRDHGTDLRRSASARGAYRSDGALNRSGVSNALRMDGVRKSARPTGSTSKIPQARTLTTAKKLTRDTEQNGSGSDSDLDLARSRLPLRKGHRNNESIGDPLEEPGTILISHQSLW